MIKYPTPLIRMQKRRKMIKISHGEICVTGNQFNRLVLVLLVFRPSAMQITSPSLDLQKEKRRWIYQQSLTGLLGVWHRFLFVFCMQPRILHTNMSVQAFPRYPDDFGTGTSPSRSPLDGFRNRLYDIGTKCHTMYELSY